MIVPGHDKAFVVGLSQRKAGLSMELRTFGRTGLRVPPIGLGGFPFGGVNRAAGCNPFTENKAARRGR